ncbi:hypothetical protein GTY67_13305 [Streptomyces sp. SID8374]|uniref:hypothetical protein n=1 Tax=Streptomyces sp. SID8374 TaxID=2690354 RepID=UPI00136ACB20|nr:hypothetical protein [Streptomyces sp. SID8374]MYX14374.1 hypothetical protein [Streptomyces sp. SID8374]
MSNRKLRLNQVRRHGAPEEVVTVTEWDVTPGLHAWITEEIGKLEAAAKPLVALGVCPEWRHCKPECYHPEGLPTNDSTTALRRCAADRKILAAHPYSTQVVNPSYGPHSAGFGCETCHDWDGVPEGRGDCPTILALAEGYGLDDEDNADVEVIRG